MGFWKAVKKQSRRAFPASRQREMFHYENLSPDSLLVNPEIELGAEPRQPLMQGQSVVPSPQQQNVPHLQPEPEIQLSEALPQAEAHEDAPFEQTSIPGVPSGALAEQTLEEIAEEIIADNWMSNARKKQTIQSICNGIGEGFEKFEERVMREKGSRPYRKTELTQRDKEFFQEIALGLDEASIPVENKHPSPEKPGIYKGKIIGLAPEIDAHDSSGNGFGRSNVMVSCSEVNGREGGSCSSFYLPLREYPKLAEYKKNRETLEIHVNNDNVAYIHAPHSLAEKGKAPDRGPLNESPSSWNSSEAALSLSDSEPISSHELEAFLTMPSLPGQAAYGRVRKPV